MTTAPFVGETVVVLEAVSAGLCGDATRSLRAEGAAMRRAAIRSLADPGRTVVSPLIRDGRLTIETVSLSSHGVADVRPADAWTEVFECGPAAGFVVAPETDGMLSSLIGDFETAGVPVPANCRRQDVELLGDKLRCYRRLGGVLPIPKTVTDDDIDRMLGRGPFVVKDRFGAGSGYRVSDRPEAAAGEVCQPFFAGRSWSVLGLFDGPRTKRLVTAWQHFETAGDRACYVGGETASNGPFNQAGQMLRSLAYVMPKLRGPVGMDFIGGSGGEWQLVDINPRLTTSFLAFELSGCWPDLFAGPAAAPAKPPRGVRWTVGDDVTVSATTGLFRG